MLFDQHHQRIYAMALRLTGSGADAEDVVQETFLRAFRFAGSFRGDCAVGTWLYRIGINAARDLCRRRPRSESPERLEHTAAAGREGEDPLARGRLERALLALPDGYREVLVMHDVLGLEHPEIAIALDIQEGTSKSQLHKARARLRERLGNPGPSAQASGRAA